MPIEEEHIALLVKGNLGSANVVTEVNGRS